MKVVSGQIKNMHMKTLEVEFKDGKKYRAEQALFLNIYEHFEIGEYVTCELRGDGTLKNMVLSYRQGGV